MLQLYITHCHQPSFIAVCCCGGSSPQCSQCSQVPKGLNLLIIKDQKALCGHWHVAPVHSYLTALCTWSFFHGCFVIQTPALWASITAGLKGISGTEQDRIHKPESHKHSKGHLALLTYQPGYAIHKGYQKLSQQVNQWVDMEFWMAFAQLERK